MEIGKAIGRAISGAIHKESPKSNSDNTDPKDPIKYRDIDKKIKKTTDKYASYLAHGLYSQAKEIWFYWELESTYILLSSNSRDRRIGAKEARVIGSSAAWF